MYTVRDRIRALKTVRKLSATLWVVGAVAFWFIISELLWPYDAIACLLFLACIIINKRIGILVGRYNLPERDVDLFLDES